jgi:uncharacterized protein (TIGR03435 family)
VGSQTLTPEQSSTRIEFDVVSIKRNTTNGSGGGRTMPDGTEFITNLPIRNFIAQASPVLTREVIGLPDWATVERYDVTVKPPAGSTPEQRAQMWRAMFAERMHLVGHVEQHERDAFRLVLARSDGRLGPDLKRSTLDCTPRPLASPSPALQRPPSLQERQSRCGVTMSGPSIVSGGTTIDQLARFLYGFAGGDVENDTGLDGFYALSLTFSRIRGAPLDTNSDDQPDIFSALQEQLGLKLRPHKKMMPVFVVDHIERPTEN